MTITYINLPEVASTSTYLKRHAALMADATVVFTHNQTAGRGQRGNTWEAEPGKNLTFSILLKRPAVNVKEQFLLSEATSIAIVETLDNIVGGATIKWPNDIYHGDKKLAGILIEQSLQHDAIDYAVIGIGLNVNQRQFLSDAPNPVSLSTLTGGKQYDLDVLLRDLCEAIIGRCQIHDKALLHRDYMARLWRGDNAYHAYRLPDGKHFEALISNVSPDGTLALLHNGEQAPRHYLFKEVIPVIDNCELKN